MLRAHMCSRPTIQTSDPDPFRGNDPDVMIQTEMMNNSIDVRTPCGIVQKAISHVQCHTFLYLDVSSTDLKINYKATLHGSRSAFQGRVFAVVVCANLTASRAACASARKACPALQ